MKTGRTSVTSGLCGVTKEYFAPLGSFFVYS